MQISKHKIILVLLIFLYLSLAFVFINITPVSADSLWNMQEGREEIPEAFGQTSGGTPRDVRDIIILVIKVLLTFLGLIFTILIIYGGFTWMTAGGSEDRVSTAKKIIVRSIIGMVVILFSYIITSFVSKCIFDVAEGSTVWMCMF